MDTTTIKQSIANYTAIVKNAPALVTLYGQGNCFNYVLPTAKELASSLSIHAYPGIYEGNLHFFLIPAAYDVSTCTDIGFHTQVCPVIWDLTSNRIPTKEAKARIKRWSDLYTTWIPQQVASTNGMFQAFDIEVQDFEVKGVKVHLGLAGNTATPGVYTADLIVTNADLTAVYYDDFATPVPPYGAAATQSSFYLLQP